MKIRYYRVYAQKTDECFGILKSQGYALILFPQSSFASTDLTGWRSYLKEISQVEYETDLAFEIKDFGTIVEPNQREFDRTVARVKSMPGWTD